MKAVNVVAAVIYDGTKFFATQRGYGEFKDWWEFPGGKIEAGETAEEALKREIREELDVDIHIVNQIATVEYDYPAFHLHMECFLCNLTEGQPQLLEAEQALWLTPEHLGSVKWLPADLVVVQKLKHHFAMQGY